MEYVNAVVCLSLPPLTNGMLSYSDSTLGENTVATPSMEAAPGLVGMMEYGVDQLQPVNVCSSS